MYRMQILMRPAQRLRLQEIATRQGRNLSEIVRQALDAGLQVIEGDAEEIKRRRLEALERIRQHRGAVLAKRGGKPLEQEPVDLIHQMREERDREIHEITSSHCS